MKEDFVMQIEEAKSRLVGTPLLRLALRCRQTAIMSYVVPRTAEVEN